LAQNHAAVSPVEEVISPVASGLVLEGDAAPTPFLLAPCSPRAFGQDDDDNDDDGGVPSPGPPQPHGVPPSRLRWGEDDDDDDGVPDPAEPPPYGALEVRLRRREDDDDDDDGGDVPDPKPPI
jgi:hypothetical protein